MKVYIITRENDGRLDFRPPDVTAEEWRKLGEDMMAFAGALRHIEKKEGEKTTND